MPQYVKIKRSKNLRFKLISLMYLIFLVLSVIQIPISWLKITPYIQSYLAKPKTSLQDTSLINFSDRLNNIEGEFLAALSFDSVTGKLPEPNSYTVTDKFFIDEGHGHDLFDALRNLHQWAERLPETDKRQSVFQKLFNEDLSNGLLKDNSRKWVSFRWKHMPAGLACNLLEELKLRAKLLNKGEIEEMKDEGKEPSFTLMTEYASMRVGDEANLSAKGDSLVQVSILRETTPVNDYMLKGNGFVFKPSAAGKHTIYAKGKVKNESMVIQVLPAGFPTKEALPFRVCYKGVEYKQSVPFHNGNYKLYCSGDADAKLNNENGLITFRPDREGWCTIRVNSGEGVLFHDSVFVKQLPEPILRVKGLPAMTISRQRLAQVKNFELQALHPSFEEGVFEIKSFSLRTVGSITRIEKLSGTFVPVIQGAANQIRYMIIYDVEVRAGMEIRKINQPLIIQII